MNDEPVEISLNDEIDLHHFHPRDAKALLNEFIDIAVERGLAEVRIVHGRGRSVIKKIVLDELGRNPLVKSFADDGANWGATRVYLKRP